MKRIPLYSIRLQIWRLCTAITLLILGCVISPLASAVGTEASPQPRIRFSINENWRYAEIDVKDAESPNFDSSSWAAVDLPHTWNVNDWLDDQPGYRRAPSWYRKQMNLGKDLRDKQLFLFFEGVHQFAQVFVNGKLAGEHKGGYTAFAFDVTALVNSFTENGSSNLLAIRVDNSWNETIPPLDIGFAHYGGIYRDVWVIATDPVHVDLLDYASPGVKITTPGVATNNYAVHVRGTVVNDTRTNRLVKVRNTVFEEPGRVLASSMSVLALKPGERASFEQDTGSMSNAKLWSPDHPNLYSVRTEVLEENRVLDCVDNAIGFRWFTFNPDKGFILNGEHLALRGVSRHQDRDGMGSALPNWAHRNDLQKIKEMGCNFVRLAHYPQDPEVLEAANRLGLIVWEEIPVVSTISTAPRLAETCRTMLKEMIRQHYNNPSIVTWGFMNEPLLNWGRTKNRDPKIPAAVLELGRQLNALAKEEDPTRVTTQAMNTADIYNDEGIALVADIAGWNIYSGWYSPSWTNFCVFVDRQHKRWPQKPIFISEFGAGSDSRLHAFQPERFDHSAEYQRLYHEYYLRQIAARPFLNGVAIWNMFDFSQPGIGESIPNMNQKGMLTFNRTPKDIFYLYQANWSKAPVLHIATREWIWRTGANPEAKSGRGKTWVKQPVQVYSNAKKVKLFLNGQSLGTKAVNDVKSALWDVPFIDGWNVLEARATKDGKDCYDITRVHFTCQAPVLSDPSVPFKELAVNAGSNCQYTDEGGRVWEVDQQYKKGGWGWVGDEKTSKRHLSYENAFGTTEDPLYQSYREGMAAYRFDVPDGDYEVDLRLIECVNTSPGARVFDISCNNHKFVERLDLAHEYGVRRAVAKTCRIRACQGNGLVIAFESSVGKPVISGIRIRRTDL